MTIKFDNVYVKETSTVAGKFESEGPLSKTFDKTYSDFYMGEDSFEKGEIKMILDSVNILLDKASLSKEDIDLFISGDLINQITPSSYAAEKLGINYMGVYAACATSTLSMIIASSMLQNKEINNCICSVSSNNSAAEKQYRNPTEYGAPKPRSATFTATGAASIYLTREKTDIRVECATLGKIIDYGENDPNNMGRVMAPAAIDTLRKHFEETRRTPDYYDLIVTGDLGRYGKEIVKDYMATRYDFDLSKNYNDCGVMLYDLERQKEVLAGGSGPVCSALVNYGYIYDEMKKKKLKKVLLVATGALFSPTLLYQKQNINSIAHAISLEVV